MLRLGVVATCIILLVGCSSSGSGRSLFDRLEFGPDECGNFEASGTIDTSSTPFVNANVHVNLNKEKPCPPKDDSPPKETVNDNAG